LYESFCDGFFASPFDLLLSPDLRHKFIDWVWFERLVGLWWTDNFRGDIGFNSYTHLSNLYR
jgi:hypothetical protein